MKTYFITGISGFLGRNLTIELLKQKDTKIVGLILPNEKHLEFYKQYESILLIEGNILNREDVDKFLSTPVEGEKYLIHVAGKITTFKRHDKLTMDINVEGTRNIIESVINKSFKKVVYVSSVDSISRREGIEEIYEPEVYDINKVDGVYSKSKVLANNLVLSAVKEYDLDASIILPSAMIGPNDPFSSPINNAVEKFLNDKLPAITKGGYDIVDVRDVARGILKVLERGEKGESYLLTGQYLSVKDLIKKVAVITNKKPISKTIPHFLIKLVSPFLEMHARIHHKTPLFTGFSMDCLKQNSNYSSKKAKDKLGYKATPIEESIIDTVNYLREKKKKG